MPPRALPRFATHIPGGGHENVLGREHPGFHGRQFDDRVHERWRSKARMHNAVEEADDEIKRIDARFARNAIGGAAGASVGLGTGIGLLIRQGNKKQTKRTKAKINRLEKRAPWNENMIGAVTGVRRGKAIDITRMQGKKTVGQKVGHYLVNNPSASHVVGAGATGLYFGSAYGISHGARKENIAVNRELRRRQAKARRTKNAQSVTKAGVRQLAETGAGYVSRNWKDARLPLAVGGVSTAGGAAAGHRHRRSRTGTAAAAGAGAGEVAWRATGLGLRERGRRLERTLPEGMSRSQRTKILRDHRKKFGIEQGEREGIRDNPRYARTYPKELPGARYKRIVGHMSGKRGLALEAAAMGAPAVLATSAARSRHGTTGVGKRDRIVREHSRTSAVRAAEAGAGAGLLALGVPRLRMVSRGLSQAAERAVDLGRPDLRASLIQAEKLRRELASGGGHIVRRLPPVLQSPGVQAAAGGLLVNRALPVTQRTYSPVREM